MCSFLLLRHLALSGVTVVTSMTAAVGLAVSPPLNGAWSQSVFSGQPSPGGQPQQAPALPGAQPISNDDRVYTADQESNTVTVINPKTDTVLGTIPLGNVRMDTNANVLGAMYDRQIDVHGLGFSRDGRYLDVVDVTTNAVHVQQGGAYDLRWPCPA
jgi:YVTN family beta-propeller protein